MKEKKILIFDDDPNILEIFSIILAEAGYGVEVSETSHDIIERVEAVQPHAVIMDNWIPDIGGVKATQLLKQHPEFRHIPVIYISANNDIHKLAQEAGAERYLAKPFDLIDLEELIEEVLADSGEEDVAT